MFKLYADLTKFGIVIFVLLSGLAGYAISYPVESTFSSQHFISFLIGLYFISSGSLALNQAQEYKLDRLMPRTEKRPVAAGKIKPAAAFLFSFFYIYTGVHFLYQTSMVAGHLGVATVVLYNFIYTIYWKRKWVFAAIPGAIPGALPVSIGFAANSSDIFSADSLYLFLIMFLWQMPHFWLLAIRFKDDYAKGGIPTLPVARGIETTIYHIGLWTFLYALVALASPWFIHASWVYLMIVLPVTFKVVFEFRKYFLSKGEKGWFSFFMWTNVSMLIYLFVPIFDKWGFLILNLF